MKYDSKKRSYLDTLYYSGSLNRYLHTLWISCMILFKTSELDYQLTEKTPSCVNQLFHPCNIMYFSQ